MAGQMALWTVLFVPIWRNVSSLYGKVTISWWGVLLGLVSISILFILFLWAHAVVPANVELPVHNQKPKVVFLTSCGMLVLMLALAGIHLVGIEAKEALQAMERSKFSVVRFQEARNTLKFLLLCTGLIIAGGTLTTGALFNAISVLNPLAPSLPKSGVLLYGAYGSAVICLVYLPAHNAIREFAFSLCEQSVPTPNVEELAAWSDKRVKLESYLGASETPLDTLKAGLSILAPLAGSAISLFIGK
jgi:hypothetical protein